MSALYLLLSLALAEPPVEADPSHDASPSTEAPAGDPAPEVAAPAPLPEPEPEPEPLPEPEPEPLPEPPPEPPPAPERAHAPEPDEAAVFTGPPLPPGIPPVPVAPEPVPEPDHGHEPEPEPEHEPQPEHGHPPEPTHPPEPVVPVPVVPVPVVPVPLPAIDVGPPLPSAPPAWDGLFPSIPQRGWSRTLALMLAAAGSLVLAGVARRTREPLRQGLLHSLLAFLETTARAAVVLAGIVFVAQIVPRNLLPLLPWALLAGAVAIGWSLRDALPDVIAWAQLASEGTLRSGQWVMGDGFSGRVVHRGLRATWVDDGRGHRVAIPNRLLTNQPVATDHERWPVIEVQLTLPDRNADTVRSALRDACLLSPWVAPRPELHIAWSPDQPERWTLRVRLLEGGFADRFRGALRERVLDVLDQRRTRRTLET